jgi:hypothetical protein
MTAHFRQSVGAAILLISSAQMVSAQVTAQDVWSDWNDYMAGYGYEVTGTESMSGDTLTVSGLTVSMDMPQNEGSVTIDMKTLVFVGNSDGTVDVTMPGVMPMRIVGADGDSEFDVLVNYTQNGNSLVVSGSPKDLSYNYTASHIGLTLASLMVDGETMPDSVAKASVTLTNVISSTQMKVGDLRDYSQRMSADSLTYDLAFDDPESDDGGTFQGGIVGLSFEGGGSIPPDMNTADLPDMLAAGFAFDGTFDYKSGNSNMNASGDGEQFGLTSTSQGGRINVAMDADRIAYDVGQNGTSISVTTNQLPFPVDVQMSETRVLVNLPVAKSDEEQDFSFIFKLRDLTVSEMIWGMLDPGAILPRDPATIVVDLSGKAKVLVDYLDPNIAENMPDVPGELNALTINQVLVSAAGAKLSGTGDFTFDNSDLATFDGMPAPTGAANLELSGANGLMDKLIQMGLMAESDAMGARMMMGMLAVPGDGEDTLKSKIEINGEGQIVANGQRIK